MDKNKSDAWIDIIAKLYKYLHESDRVMHTADKGAKKRDNLYKYFERLERVHNKIIESKSKSADKLLKKFYHDIYVIKPEDIPENYFINEQKRWKERGFNDTEITPARKKTLIQQIITNQEESLDKLIDYFLYDEESKSYEMWEKFWVFQGLQKLGKYDKEKGCFSRRDKNTVYPFPPVEREAIFNTLKLMEDYIKGKNNEEDLKNDLGNGNFKKLYEYSLKQLLLKDTRDNNSIDGKWVKYNQGSDYNILRDSLQGYYTGWCTAAGENFAKEQLSGGDFYVYYSMDENNEPKIPRIAIRMYGKYTIKEIRGVAKNQNIESMMMPILNEMLRDFPDKDMYQKKEYDMQYLTFVYNKAQKNIELSTEELRFLYEIDDVIEGFGYCEDSRINEIKQKRSLKKDYACIYNCTENEVGSSLSDLEKNNIKLFIGDLNIDYLKSAKGLILPQIIVGSLDLSGLTNTEGLKLPKIIDGFLNLRGLTSTDGLVLPQKVGGTLILDGLTSADGLILPSNIGWGIFLKGLKCAKGLKLPQKVKGDLDLSGLLSTDNLVLPQFVGGSLDLNGLTSVDGLILPQKVEEDVLLNNLINADGLVFPKFVGRFLFLNNLKSAKGVKLPKIVGSSLILSGLTSADGLILPQIIDGDLFLDGLESTQGLVLPTGFDLNNLYIDDKLKAEIEINPEKYYRNAENFDVRYHYTR